MGCQVGPGQMLMRGGILVHRAVEGPFADDGTSVFPPSCCCCRGACRGVAAAGLAAAGATPGRSPPTAAWCSAAVLYRLWPPSSCLGIVHCSRF